MPRIRLSDTVPYQAQQMFDLVMDVPRYPEFLPWCVKARVFDQREGQFVAELTISFRGFRDSFQTVDRYEPGRRVEVKLRSGPFKHLDNEWRFTPVAGGTRVEFSIDFQFKNRIMDITLGPVFTQVSKQMLEAFRNRAQTLYD
ncbi:MAG: type II toxin-antitoxin system RatA family toxin [Magnetococcales bacterium]|nr:type II toxin-antitoxin system RatA family toxin [Magnetococcales bacterium]